MIVGQRARQKQKDKDDCVQPNLAKYKGHQNNLFENIKGCTSHNGMNNYVVQSNSDNAY